MLFNTISKYLMLPLAIALGGLVLFTYVQTKKVWQLEAEEAVLKQELIDFKAGSILAESLRIKNQELENELVQLKRELRNVQDYDINLSDDLIELLERMR